MNPRVVRLLAALGAVVVAAACTPGGGSIYYTLENEVKVEDLSLPNAITVHDVAKIGASYYAAAGTIWTVTDAVLDDPDGQWDVDATIAPPAGGDACTALVASPFGTGTLYGGFINASGSRGLFESTAAPSFSGKTAIGDLGTAQVARLKTANDGVDDWLLVFTAVPPADPDAEGAHYTYGIAAYDGATWTGFGPSTYTVPFSDMIWSSTFGGRWLATGGAKLYTKDLAGVGALSDAYMTGITAGEELVGLFDDGSRVYVASKAGAVYYAASYGTTWKRIEAPTISGAHPPLTRFAGPVDPGILLVGSDGYGYYLLDTTILTSTDPSPLSRFSNTTIDLHAAAILSFSYDAAGDRVFACTSMGGLWRGEIARDGEGTIAWNLE